MSRDDAGIAGNNNTDGCELQSPVAETPARPPRQRTIDGSCLRWWNVPSHLDTDVRRRRV